MVRKTNGKPYAGLKTPSESRARASGWLGARQTVQLALTPENVADRAFHRRVFGPRDPVSSQLIEPFFTLGAGFGDERDAARAPGRLAVENGHGSGFGSLWANHRSAHEQLDGQRRDTAHQAQQLLLRSHSELGIQGGDLGSHGGDGDGPVQRDPGGFALRSEIGQHMPLGRGQAFADPQEFDA